MIGLLIMTHPQMILQYHVHNLLRNDDDLLRSLAVNPLLCHFMTHDSCLDGFIIGISREVEGEASLTVERDGVLDGVFLLVVFVAYRPLSVAYRSGVAQCFPQFFCQMRSERSNQDNQSLQYFLVAALQGTEFIHTNHECTDRSILREGFDVTSYILDKFMDRLQFFLSRFTFYW